MRRSERPGERTDLLKGLVVAFVVRHGDGDGLEVGNGLAGWEEERNKMLAPIPLPIFFCGYISISDASWEYVRLSSTHAGSASARPYHLYNVRKHTNMSKMFQGRLCCRAGMLAALNVNPRYYLIL